MILTSDNRPWGRWEEYLNEPGYRVKRLIVSAGKRLSLQKHAQRSEYWVIVGGQGILTLNDEKRRVSVGDTLSIPIGGVHRIENDAAGDLIIIETQLGVCLEEDIGRLEDDWGRT
jgi:mannose-6-phosphate isomerase-like protein (cupin superfamily)